MKRMGGKELTWREAAVLAAGVADKELQRWERGALPVRQEYAAHVRDAVMQAELRMGLTGWWDRLQARPEGGGYASLQELLQTYTAYIMAEGIREMTEAGAGEIMDVMLEGISGTHRMNLDALVADMVDTWVEAYMMGEGEDRRELDVEEMVEEIKAELDQWLGVESPAQSHTLN